MNYNHQEENRDFNTTLLLAISAVLFLGISSIITISIGSQSTADPMSMVWKQLFRLVSGVTLLCITAAVPFEKIKKAVPYLTVSALILLYALPFWGVKINGMRGWFRFGILNFQPSEPGKIIFLAGLVMLLTAKRVEHFSDFCKTLLCGAYTAVWLAALLLQPDMGTAAVYAAVFPAVLFLGRIKLRYIASLLLAGAASGVTLVMLHPYALKRITGFLNPEQDTLGSNWHLNQLLRSVSRGSWFGVKSGNALWSRSYLPFAYNDSSFAAICETTGAIGAALIPAIFLALGLFLTGKAEKYQLSQDRKLLVSGAAFMLIFQSFLHISVNLGLFPVTGITLVFVSYGGSSMFSGCLILGTVLSALKQKGYKQC